MVFHFFISLDLKSELRFVYFYKFLSHNLFNNLHEVLNFYILKIFLFIYYYNSHQMLLHNIYNGLSIKLLEYLLFNSEITSLYYLQFL